jgi:hypothetical protein
MGLGQILKALQKKRRKVDENQIEAGTRCNFVGCLAGGLAQRIC